MLFRLLFSQSWRTGQRQWQLVEHLKQVLSSWTIGKDGDQHRTHGPVSQLMPNSKVYTGSEKAMMPALDFPVGFLVWLERSLSCLLGTPYWWCWPVVCISFIIHRVLLISCLAPGHALHVPPETESVLSSNSFCISGSLHPTAAKSHPVVELWKMGNLPIIPVSFFFTKVCFLLIRSFILIIWLVGLDVNPGYSLSRQMLYEHVGFQDQLIYGFPVNLNVESLSWHLHTVTLTLRVEEW